MFQKIKTKMETRKLGELKKEALRICITYFLFGFLWIYFSDRIVDSLINEKNVLLLINTYKGTFYVILSSVILYVLLRRMINKIQTTESKLNESYEELSAANEELQAYVEQLMASEEMLRVQYDQIINTERKLRISERKYKTLITQMQLGLALFEGEPGDKVTDYRLIDANESHQHLTGFIKEEIKGKRLAEMNPLLTDSQILILQTVIDSGEPNRYKREQTLTNKRYEIIAYRPQEFQLAIIVNDITERKLIEDQLEYLSYHDQLTGLYNRRFFDKIIKQFNHPNYLPLTLTMGDINGLKLINDSFGHNVGDEYIKKIAEVMKKSYRSSDYVCRLSGDEFVILSPNTYINEIEKLIGKFKESAKAEKVKSVDLSISFGYCSKEKEEESIAEVLKKAEDFMYRKKMLESPSLRGKTVKTIITTLHEKNAREELHSQRVSELCEAMGIALGMSEDEQKELKTVGLLHDIGKVAIEESILNKPDKLTEEEWEEIKKHPEIGYRILSTVNNMAEMAEYILAHHERWDGTGYPKGLQGEQIPMQSRIISVVDAYDAMISERSYRNALTKEIAIEELRRNAGIQFDPALVGVFITEVIKEYCISS